MICDRLPKVKKVKGPIGAVAWRGGELHGFKVLPPHEFGVPKR